MNPQSPWGVFSVLAALQHTIWSAYTRKELEPHVIFALSLYDQPFPHARHGYCVLTYKDMSRESLVDHNPPLPSSWAVQPPTRPVPKTLKQHCRKWLASRVRPIAGNGLVRSRSFWARPTRSCPGNSTSWLREVVDEVGVRAGSACIVVAPLEGRFTQASQ